MIGEDRQARRTERYLDDLMAADRRRAATVPADIELDEEIRLAARALRAGLVRVHPSFRFEEALAERLADSGAAGRSTSSEALAIASGGSVEEAVTSRSSGWRISAPSGGSWRGILPPAAVRRLPEASRRPRSLIVGGVGVASAAISIGAVYVAWRHAHPGRGRMERAARAAHGRAEVMP